MPPGPRAWAWDGYPRRAPTMARRRAVIWIACSMMTGILRGHGKSPILWPAKTALRRRRVLSSTGSKNSGENDACDVHQGASMRLLNCAALAAVLAMAVCAPARSATTWTEGVNYFLIVPARPTSLPPGKVEVTEVFSYACPARNLFVPTMHKLKASLPPNAVFDFLPAAFNPTEDWPMFQPRH